MSNTDLQSLDREGLEAIANDLGIKFRSDVKDDTLRARISEALGEPAPADAPAELPAAPGEVAKAKRYTIIIATSDDKQPVQVGVNGKMYVIKRGEKVVVPESVVEVLRNAVQDVYDPETMEKSNIMSYPFQVLGEA